MSTGYNKTAWQDGDIITADKMNNIENGIKDVEDTIGELKENLTDLQELADTKATAIYETASGEIASFSDGADDLPMKSCVVKMEPIQEGSGDPSLENVRPISGRTGVEINNCTRYLRLRTNAPIKTSDHGVEYDVTKYPTIVITGTATGGTSYSNLIGGAASTTENTISTGTHKFQVVGDIDDGINVVISANGSVIANLNSQNRSEDYIATSDTVIVWYINVTNGSTVECSFFIAIGDGQQIDVSFPTAAGTVYGGTLDVVSGKLVVDRAVVTMNGSQPIGESQDKRFYAFIPSAFTVNASNQATYKGVICDKFPSYSWSGLVGAPIGCAPVWGQGIGFKHPDMNAIDDWKTYFANNPTVFSYELATPTEIQLTPQEVRTLLGENNIWSDGGDVEVEYAADTKLYIEKLTTPTEDDMIADHAISANSFFMVGNTLYRATTAIASGATITVGTNAVKLSLSDALNALA